MDQCPRWSYLARNMMFRTCDRLTFFIDLIYEISRTKLFLSHSITLNMLSTHPSNFRVRLMFDLFSALAVPSIILKLILRLCFIHLGRCATVVYVAFIFCRAMLKGAYAASKQHELAGQLALDPYRLSLENGLEIWVSMYNPQSSNSSG